MTEFCPQCGAARLGVFRFCRGCRLDFDALEAGGAPTVTVPATGIPAAGSVTAGKTGVRFTPRRVLVVGVVVFFGLAAIGSRDPADPVPAAVATSTPAPTAQVTASAVARTTVEPTQTPEPTFGPSGPTTVATVVRVVDGDTIRVDIDGVEYPVRYIGMDTPEPDAKEPAVRELAAAATVANAALVEGREVILEGDVSETDQFHRLLRNVWVEDAGSLRLVNLELIEQGFAQVSTYPPDVKYVDLLTAAQETARAAETGMWAPEPTPAPTPTPLVVIDEELRSIVLDARERFAGRVGTYTWAALAFPGDRITLRWSASAASVADCRVAWQIQPDSGDIIKGTIRVDAGESNTGNHRYGTAFSDASFVVKSTCGVWKMSMEGYEPPPPTPAPTRAPSGGGGSCHPSYSGACLKVNASDYDCQGGSGNGPYYTGRVSVVGPDVFDLDRDGDGVGCE